MVPIHIQHGFFMEDFYSLPPSPSLSLSCADVNIRLTARVNVTHAHIDFRSVCENFRPYLYLRGKLDSLSGSFPLNIARVDFPPSSQESKNATIEFVYEFSDNELALLAKAGLWSTDFALPKNIVSNVYEIPCECAVKVVEPEHESDAPLVFVNTHGHTPVLSAATCGYSIGHVICNSLSPSPRTDSPVVLSDNSTSQDTELPLLSLGTTKTNIEEAPSNAKLPLPQQPTQEKPQVETNNQVNNDSLDGQKHTKRISEKSLQARQNALNAARAGRSAAIRRSFLSQGNLDSAKIRNALSQPQSDTSE